MSERALRRRREIRNSGKQCVIKEKNAKTSVPESKEAAKKKNKLMRPEGGFHFQVTEKASSKGGRTKKGRQVGARARGQGKWKKKK